MAIKEKLENDRLVQKDLELHIEARDGFIKAGSLMHIAQKECQ